MSSALKAQLAALNGTAGKHPGLTVAGTLRHEDAVGRGIDYSLQRGQVVYNRGLGLKATLVYASPREAADIPLQTLQENCQEALRSLSEILPSLSSASVVLCGNEEASKAYLQRLLVRLCILLGEKDEAVTTSCLHVLEYLLRRYEIHRHLMEDLVWTMLPHHQQLTNLWHRTLLLVDLASHPSYLWLRPFADPRRPAPTPRALCAQHILQEIPLLRKACSMVSAISQEIPDEENRGAAHILSWAAACLVDGLVWQQQTARGSLDREAVARILVPAVRQALAADWEDQRGWGCVIASAMAECLDLSEGVVAQWGTALLQRGADDETAWSALASILLAGQNVQRVEEESYLPLFSRDDWIGCPLPIQIHDKLTADCAAHLGSLYQSLEVTPLVVAIFVRAVRASNGTLAVALLQEENLTSLWKKHDLVASVAAWVVSCFAEDQIELKTSRAVLQALCDYVAQASCERGVAHAASSVDDSKVSTLLEGIVTLVQSLHMNSTVLPPRVALEHPDVAVRRDALRKLLSDPGMLSADYESDGESLVETLVRRWSVEPDVALAMEFATALLGVDTVLVTADRMVEQCQNILSAAYHWIDSGNVGTKEIVQQIVDKAVREADELGESGSTFQLLQEMSTGLIDLADASQSMQALSVLSDNEFVRNMTEKFGKAEGAYSQAESRARQRCSWVLLSALGDATNGEKNLAPLYLQICIYLMRTQSPSRDSEQQCLKAALDQISSLLAQSPEQIVTALVDLTSLQLPKMDTVVVPVLQKLASCAKDESGKQVSPHVVLLEAAVKNSTSAASTQRLLKLAAEHLEKGNGLLGIVPALAMLSHSDKQVREAAVGVLSSISDNQLSSKGKGRKKSLDTTGAVQVCRVLSSDATSVIQLGGALASHLSRCAQQSGSGEMKAALVQLAAHAVMSAARPTKNEYVKNFSSASWLSPTYASGTRETGCQILEAMEVAGEDAFPLSLRWENAGRPLLNWLLALDQGGETSLIHVADLVGKMLKGVTISSPEVVVSSGPDSAGRRSRSYSVGTFAGATVIQPYPDSMIAAVQKAIEKSVVLRRTVVEVVTGSSSWSGYIFPALSTAQRKTVVRALLQASSVNQDETLVRAAAPLPLDGQETAELIGEVVNGNLDLPYLAAVLDYVRTSAARLAEGKGVDKAVTSLFSMVRLLSTVKQVDDDEDGIDYLLHSAVLAIRDILDASSVSNDSANDESFLQGVDLVLALLNAPRQGSLAVTRHVTTWKAKAACLSILSSMASRNPEIVVESIGELVLKAASSPESFDVKELQSMLGVAVPTFWSNVASSKKTFASFLADILGLVMERPDAVRRLLLQDLLRSLSIASGVSEKYRLLSPGILSVMLVTVKDKLSLDMDWKDHVVVVFDSALPQSQIKSLAFLLRTARQTIGHIVANAENSENDASAYLVSIGDVLGLMNMPQKSSKRTGAALQFIFDVLSAASECIVMESIQKQLRKRSPLVGASSLQLWQDLLMISDIADSAALENVGGNQRDLNSWKKVALLADECRETVQANLPASVFVAAVRSFLKESSASALRARALRLAADRALLVGVDTQSRAIFCELLPEVIELAQNQTEDIRSRQCAILFIEHVARLFSQGTNEKLGQSVFLVFDHALSVFSDLIKLVTSGDQPLGKLETSSWNLMASADLACATIIRATGVRSLPKISPLVGPQFLLLKFMNSKRTKDFNEEWTAQQGMIRAAILRLLRTIIETVPQSVYSHLPVLLSESTVFSDSIRSTLAMTSILNQFDEALLSNVPSRLLIPTLVKSMSSCKSPNAQRHMLVAVTSAVRNLEVNGGGIYRKSVMKAVTMALEFRAEAPERKSLVHAATECLLALILKLSELQFQKLYADLSEWTGSARSERKYAFWSLSDAISKELQSIFLPCASLIFDDLVKDLNSFAVGMSKEGGVQTLHDGRKKRKLSSEDCSDLDQEAMSSLVPLLATTTSILRADAQNGGKWTREHGRYNTLLEPLGKLLQLRVPENFPALDGQVDPFEFIVEQNEDGCVVNTLTSLALAAGDEQLWKPLNHAVLSACGNEHRSEVRKAGVVCLLSLLRSLGDDYMVLLPECLPVLAEMLEDENEVVAGLARDAVSTAEELLGESLEASLR